MSLLVDQMDPDYAQRKRWMQVLARAGTDLYDYEQRLRQRPHQFVRPAQTGMAMVRGQAGGQGSRFNLGEMTVTRCAVQLDDGRQGFSYVAGRDLRHAELAALADAYLQGSEQAWWMQCLIEPLACKQAQLRAQSDARSALTQVDFVTMVRGED
jgi:alpha-D-ribose 1-methylphosphonate 5-triphosphate synthase subunit PhnG